MPRLKTIKVTLTEDQIERLKKATARWQTPGDEISWALRVLVDKFCYSSNPLDESIVHSDSGRLFQIPPCGHVWFNWGLVEREARTDSPFQNWAKAIVALRDGEVAISGDQWSMRPLRTKMQARRIAAKARTAAHEATKRKPIPKKLTAKTRAAEKPSKPKRKAAARVR